MRNEGHTWDAEGEGCVIVKREHGQQKNCGKLNVLRKMENGDAECRRGRIAHDLTGSSEREAQA